LRVLRPYLLPSLLLILLVPALVPRPVVAEAQKTMLGPLVPPQSIPQQVTVAAVLPPEAVASVAAGQMGVSATPRLAYPLARPAESMDPWGWRYSERRGAWRMHTGVDLAADQGTPVLAALAGRVVLLEPISGYGTTVVVDHGNGWQTLYAHLHDSVVAPGQWLEQGERLGSVGMTGQASGPHLHFELRHQGPDLLALDPTPYLPPLLPPPSLPPVLATIAP
jgi:murein DD-endopeptidase MepM/ murein hydrolase activator NlpD